MPRANSRRKTRAKRINRRVPVKKVPGRAIPGTVFNPHEVMRVYDRNALERLDKLHENGKLDLIFRVKGELAGKYSLEGHSKGVYWFAPWRRASTRDVGKHGRSIFTDVGNEFIVFKGSGAKMGVVGPPGMALPKAVRESRLRPSLGHHENPTYTTYKLWGGTLIEHSEYEASVAQRMHEAFNRMKRRGDRVVRMATVPPTLFPIVILRPLQIPFELIQNPDRKVRSKRSVLKVEQRRASRILGFSEIAGEQSYFVYSCVSPYRIRDLGYLSDNMKRFRDNKINSVGQERNDKDIVLHWKSLFELHGFKLDFRVDNRIKDGGELIVHRRVGGGWRKCSMKRAVRGIVDSFVRNLAANVRVVHKELSGAFGDTRDSALAKKDVSLAGQIFDLDVVSLNIRDPEKRKKWQELDRAKAEFLIGLLVLRMLPRPEADFIANQARKKFLKLLDREG